MLKTNQCEAHKEELCNSKTENFIIQRTVEAASVIFFICSKSQERTSTILIELKVFFDDQKWLWDIKLIRIYLHTIYFIYLHTI